MSSRKSKRGAILGTALDQFAHHGSNGTCVDMIAEAVSASQESVCGQFEGVDAQLPACTNQLIGSWVIRWSERRSGSLCGSDSYHSLSTCSSLSHVCDAPRFAVPPP